MAKYNLVTLILFLSLDIITAFNIDVQTNTLVFNISTNDSTDTSSHFGYAINFFNTTAFKLIVGAPDDAKKTGNVYECPLQQGTKCTNIVIPQNEELEKNIGYRGTAERLGSVVKTTENSVLVCSPIWNDVIDKTQYGNLPIYGRCITLNRTLGVKNITSPCHQVPVKTTRLEGHGFCEGGFSAELVETKSDGTYTIMAGVGSWDHRGSLIAVKDGLMKSRFTNLEGQDPVITEDSNFETAEESSLNFTEVNSLLGYSTTSGAFQGPGKEPGIASGSPRQVSLKGQVLVYTLEIVGHKQTNISLIATIDNPDKDIASFFGSSIAAIDYNNDTFDDLLVGSPLHSSHKTTDNGRVYVFRNMQNGTIFKVEEFVLTGEKEKGGRFGTTVTNVGDINGDGTDDVAVGAPFGGKDGKGAVYIYNVRNKSINKKYSQVLYSPGAHSFGFSITAKKVDTRVYPAFAVGAPLDGQVYVFQTKTVITLKDALDVSEKNIPTESFKSNCRAANKTYYCVKLLTTLQDISTNPPETFELNIEINVEPTNTLGIGKRAYLMDSSKQLVSSITEKVDFTRQGNVTVNKTVYFSLEKTIDFRSAVVITTKYYYMNASQDSILDQFGAIKNKMEVKYKRKCGDDDICDIDLAIIDANIKVNGNDDNLLLLGSSNDEVFVNAFITNNNESAYLSRMFITFSSDFDVVQIQLNTRNAEFAVQDINSTSYKTISILLGNPISNGAKGIRMSAKFFLRKDLSAPSMLHYKFDIMVNSTGRDYNLNNNNKTVSVKAGIETCLEVQLDTSEAKKNPNPITYDYKAEIIENIKAVGDIGPLSKYNFLIQNNGPTNLEDMTVELQMIDHFKDKNDDITNVLYVYDLTGDNMICNRTGVNANDYQIESNTTSVKARRRRRRDTEVEMEKYEDLNCEAGYCKTYTCKITSLSSRSPTKLTVLFAVYRSALKTVKAVEPRLFVTFGGKYKDILRQRSRCNQSTTFQQTFLSNEVKIEKLKKEVEWWIVLLAIIGALIILAVFCVILYRVGFFKRHRVQYVEMPTATKAEVIPVDNEGLEDD